MNSIHYVFTMFKKLKKVIVLEIREENKYNKILNYKRSLP